MERISSGMTFFYKRIFPAFWFGFLGIFVIVALIGDMSGNGSPLPFLIGPAIMAVFGFFLIKKLIWDLADEVLDAGDSLIVRFENEQEQVPFANIINLDYSYMTSPPRVTLTLRTPCRFGGKISFCPPLRFIPFARSAVIDDLIRRVDAARQAAR
jgi:hypothetical protein